MANPFADHRTAQGLAFPPTQWTLVLRARLDGDEGRAALDELCRRYWHPIYAYLRRRGHSPADAEDGTQQFFAEVLADETLHAVHPAQGRLRTFLLAALQRSLTDQRRYRTRQKRGGGTVVLSLESARAEELYFPEPADSRDPEKLFYAAWARSLVEAAKEMLRASYGSRAAIYQALEPYLDPSPSVPAYDETAALLGVTQVTVRVHVSRLRKRFAELLRQQVRQTVESEAEVAAELDWLLRALRAG
jgi:RNA polymerase sigma-70 factor (ECF subfamily)